jgi:hypothetical protein
LGVLFATAWAESNIRVNVKTVLASQDEAYIDPALSAVVKELESLFRYSSYRLLSENRLNLALKKTGSVNLPGERVLMITPTGIQADRVEMKLVILRKNSQVFETVIQLLNRGSIIVGGPKHQNGSLLFSISASY